MLTFPTDSMLILSHSPSPELVEVMDTCRGGYYSIQAFGCGPGYFSDVLYASAIETRSMFIRSLTLTTSLRLLVLAT